jgi:hypothetical protein
MPLHLIIDGYNLIRQSRELSSLDARDLAAGREALLDLLAAYRRARPAHQVTVIFDGREAGDVKESRDRRQGVAIIYSRRGEAADEVIKRLLSREGARGVAVTSDRELQAWAQRVGAAWLGSLEFERGHLRGREPALAEEDGADSSARAGKKTGPARRLPKRERRLRQRLRKL